MHERVAINAVCFADQTFRVPSLTEMADLWRQLGPRRVSFVEPLIAGDFMHAVEVVNAGRYAVETIAHPFVSGPIDCSEPEIESARSNLSDSIRAAAALGARSIYVLSGGHGSLKWEQAAERFARAIEPCVAEANAARVLLAVENSGPQSAHWHLAHSLRDTLTLAELAGIGVCMDIHHCWWEAGLDQTITRAADRLHLVQVSDYVYGDRGYLCRAVPGDGDIPLWRIIDWALTAGYQNGFDLELIGGRIDDEGHPQATRRAAEWTSDLLDRLGA
jgi:sugar phosphate isomerase/epimerase